MSLFGKKKKKRQMEEDLAFSDISGDLDDISPEDDESDGSPEDDADPGRSRNGGMSAPDAVQSAPVPMVSVVSQEWAADIVFSNIQKKIRRKNFGLTLFLALVSSLTWGSLFGVTFIRAGITGEIGDRMQVIEGKVARYLESGQRMRDYQGFADLINTPSLAVQMSPVTAMCVRDGLIVRAVEFSDTLTPDVRSKVSESFLLDERGRSIDSIKVFGQWKVDAMARRDAPAETRIDSNWGIRANRDLKNTWAPAGYNAYAMILQQRQAGPDWDSVEAVFIIWK